MGLDTVELIMEVEECFDITIPDAEAEKIQTVGSGRTVRSMTWSRRRTVGGNGSGWARAWAGACRS
jgi:hypothetical protein